MTYFSRHCFLFTIVFLYYNKTSAQPKISASDNLPVYWLIKDPASFANLVINKGSDTSRLYFNSSSNQLGNFNFHPSIRIQSGIRMSLPINPGKLSQATIFTVYKAEDTVSEFCIWHFAKKDSAKIVLTTNRLSYLDRFEYMNFTDKVRANPKLNIYIQGKGNDSTAEPGWSWEIGNRPLTPQLPISDFKGLIPEILVYDKILSSTERLQISSYLAIKYGITLSDPSATYLNNNGIPIWNGNDYLSFHNNIAGIGRDDAFGLLQKISASGNLPELLTISTGDSLQNDSYLLWGDNGEPLRAGVAVRGVPMMLKKKWMLVSTGLNQQLKVNFEIDTKQFDIKLPANPVYWLAINENGYEDPSRKGTFYYKMNSIDSKGFAYFKNIILQKPEGTQTLFLIPGLDILLNTQITDARCLPYSKGSIETSILGGLPPFKIFITDHSSDRKINAVNDGTIPYKLTALDAGNYSIKVIDQRGQIAVDSFFINNEDGPLNANLPTSKAIPRGSYIDLDAGQCNSPDVEYYWQGPTNFVSFRPSIHISTPGLYSLKMTRNGCSNLQNISILTMPENIFDNNINLYPNPSTGRFTAAVSIGNPAPVTMHVYDRLGRLVSTTQKEGMSNYRFEQNLLASGAYKVVFVSGQYMAARQLVISK